MFFMRRWFLSLLLLIGIASLWMLRPPRVVEVPTATNTVAPPPPAAPIVLPTDPMLGPRTAPHTIVVVSDFTCPACADAAVTLRDLQREHGDTLRVVWKDFTHLNTVTGSRRHHIAARCAQEQGKFWEYHDALFAQSPRTDDDLHTIAQDLVLNLAAFDACRAEPRPAALVDANTRDATRRRYDGTPTIFVNGAYVPTPSTQTITDALDANP